MKHYVYDHVTDIPLELIENLKQEIPDPDSWAINNREKYNNTLSESRSFILRWSDQFPLNQLNEAYDKPERDRMPAIEPILDIVKEVGWQDLGRITFAYLGPGKNVYNHRDRGKYLTTYTRFMIPITTNPEVVTFVDGKAFTPEIGKAYLFNNQLFHSVSNMGETGRITLIVDVK